MSPLPSGPGQTDKDHSLSVTQASDSPDVVDLDATKASLASLDAKIPAKGTAVMAGSMPVTLATNDTLGSTLATGPKQDTGNVSLAAILAMLAKLRPIGALTSATAGASGIFVFPVTTASVAFNLTVAAYTNLLAAIVAGQTLKLKAGGADVYYRWGAASGTVDETKTAVDTPLSQAEQLSSGEREDLVAPASATFLMIKGSQVGYLRITISEA